MDKQPTAPKTLVEAIRYFADPDVCLDYMIRSRWGSRDAVRCPTCGSERLHFLAERRLFQCNTKHPKRQFSVKVGTIFEDSPLGLDQWLPALWLLTTCKNGVSSYEIARALGITQKSAWFMMHRLRLTMQDGGGTLAGEVEVDETFIGGKARFMHKWKRDAKITGTGGMNKSAVMGLLERHGPKGHSRVRVKPVPNIRRRTLAPEVRQHVAPGTAVYTDGLKSYKGLAPDYAHEVIDHAEAYVRGKVHTNGLENFWSLLKRAVKGTYVSVEPFHLFRYLDEQAFRFNTRKQRDGERFADVVPSVVGRRLTWRRLVGQEPVLATT